MTSLVSVKAALRLSILIANLSNTVVNNHVPKHNLVSKTKDAIRRCETDASTKR